MPHGFLASNILVHSVERNGFDQVEVGFIDSVGCLQESSTQRYRRVVEAVRVLGQQSKLGLAGTVSAPARTIPRHLARIK